MVPAGNSSILTMPPDEAYVRHARTRVEIRVTRYSGPLNVLYSEKNQFP